METNSKQKGSKHMRPFWPLMIVFVLAALLGGIILGVAYSNQLQDEIFSLSFMPQREGQKSQPKTAAKTSAPSPTPKAY